MRENTSIEWVNKEEDSEGNFNRQKNQFETPFGEGEGKLPVEPGRYRLLWAPVCPWAHRSDRRMAESRRTLCADTGNVPGI